MKKLLFISNICRNITNFHLTSYHTAKKYGYEFHFAANFCNMQKGVQENYPEIHFHQIDFVRFPFHPKNLRAYRQLIHLIEGEQIDWIHCNTPIGGSLGRICGKKCGVKKNIYTAHGFHFYKGAPFFNRMVLQWAERFMAHWTDAIITMNQEDYEAAQKFKLRNHGKVYYVPGVGINTAQYHSDAQTRADKRRELGFSDDDIICISMGDLIKRKNYPVSIEAVAKAKNLKIHYLICGKGPEKENLEKRVADLGVADKVHFMGFRTDVKELLNASDIFLFSTLQEGLPRSMMEAMASGLPCIASRIRGNVDLLIDGKGGYLCNPMDVDAFTEVIKKVAENDQLRYNMSKFNMNRIKDYDVNVVEKRINEIYKEVLGVDV